jgi:hypothetical protein
MTDKFDPILISLIRKNWSGIVAQDIIGAQPMTNPYNSTEFPYLLDVLTIAKYTDIIEITRWCRENLPKDDWTHTGQFFAFKTEQSYSWFLLRWS